MYAGTGSEKRAIAASDAAQTASVAVSTRRMPQRPIHRLVTGPATAWPIEVAASTRPAAP
jgi:hypothetical protein